MLCGAQDDLAPRNDAHLRGVVQEFRPAKDAEVSDTELLGAPTNGEAWRKLQRRRALKVLTYLEDAMRRACSLAWLLRVSSVMRRRHTLFKQTQSPLHTAIGRRRSPSWLILRNPL